MEHSLYSAGVHDVREHRRWPINITEIGRQNIEEKHREGGPYTVDRSVFRTDVAVEQIAEWAASVRPTFQPSTGRWLRVVEVDAEEPVGWDRYGEPRWEFTVVTEGDRRDERHDLFNAFPGRPNE